MKVIELNQEEIRALRNIFIDREHELVWYDFAKAREMGDEIGPDEAALFGIQKSFHSVVKVGFCQFALRIDLELNPRIFHNLQEAVEELDKLDKDDVLLSNPPDLHAVGRGV